MSIIKKDIESDELQRSRGSVWRIVQQTYAYWVTAAIYHSENCDMEMVVLILVSYRRY